MTAFHREETNTILSVGEIVRRIVWVSFALFEQSFCIFQNFIRIENEHVGRTRERFKNQHRRVTKLPSLMTEKQNFIDRWRKKSQISSDYHILSVF